MTKLKKQVINGIAPVTMAECVYLNDGRTVEEKLKFSSGIVSSGIDWSNIKWTVIGDSLTDSTINANKKYHQIIKEKTGIQVQELAKGGTGYTSGYDSNDAFIDRISSINSDVDIVTLFGSVNDWKNNQYNSLCSTIGSVTDIYDDSKTVIENTFCANLNKTFDKLNEVCPNAQVIVFGAMPYYGVNQKYFEDVRNALKSVCEARHIPYVDMFDSTGFYRIMSVREYATTYTTDFKGNNYVTQTNFGHPNNLAHEKIIAPKFFEELKKWIITYTPNTPTTTDAYTQSCTSEYILDKMYPMGQAHEAIPSGLITDTWKYKTRWENQTRPIAAAHNCGQSGCPGTGLFQALGCWSSVYRVEGTPFSQNTGVEMKDIKVYGWYNGQWELVQHLPVPNGNFYAESFGGDASKYFADSIKETSTSKTIILREANKIEAMNWNTGQLQTENCMYHPFTDVKYFDTKYEYIYSCIDLRKVKWDENGIDDRDRSHYCSNCGADWWLSEGLMFHESWQHNKGVCQPKMIEITNEWKRFSMTTVPENWEYGFPK